MTKAYVLPGIGVVVFSLILGPLAKSQPSAERQKALDMILHFADRLCNTVPTEGRDGRLELSGKAQAELSALIKKIVNIGVEGAANISRASTKAFCRRISRRRLQ